MLKLCTQVVTQVYIEIMGLKRMLRLLDSASSDGDSSDEPPLHKRQCAGDDTTQPAQETADTEAASEETPHSESQQQSQCPTPQSPSAMVHPQNHRGEGRVRYRTLSGKWSWTMPDPCWDLYGEADPTESETDSDTSVVLESNPWRDEIMRKRRAIYMLGDDVWYPVDVHHITSMLGDIQNAGYLDYSMMLRNANIPFSEVLENCLTLCREIKIWWKAGITSMPTKRFCHTVFGYRRQGYTAYHLVYASMHATGHGSAADLESKIIERCGRGQSKLCMNKTRSGGQSAHGSPLFAYIVTAQAFPRD
jgi:hypothetical protein